MITDVTNVSIKGTIYKPLYKFLKLSSVKMLSTELFVSINSDGISSLTYTRILTP